MKWSPHKCGEKFSTGRLISAPSWLQVLFGIEQACNDINAADLGDELADEANPATFPLILISGTSGSGREIVAADL